MNAGHVLKHSMLHNDCLDCIGEVVSPTTPVPEKKNHNSTEMNVLGYNTAPMMASSQAPTKSALSMQLEEFDRGSFVSTLNTPNNADTSSNHDRPTKSAVSNERLFLRKISKMISDERWHEMNEFLQSPTEVAAYRSGFELAASPARWHKITQGKHMHDVIGLTSSVNDMSLDIMASLGSIDLNPMEVVHFACRFNPPRTIIRHLASLYPEGSCYPDKMGRLPLHYAVKWGASYRLIDYLVEKDRSAASAKDENGKTPLHLLCENYSSSVDTNKTDDLSPEDNMVQALKTLIKAAPDAVNIEDNDGTTVVEYAIASDSPYDAVRRIQKASEVDWKERKKASTPGEGSHKQIEEKLIREQQQNQRAQEMDREMKRMNDVTTGQVQLNNVQPTRKSKARSKYAMTA